MAAKRIRVRLNDQAPWRTLPGASGEKRTEQATWEDTVFGQEFTSEDSGLGQVTISANAYFKGVAGYTARLRKGGTPTALADAPTTLLEGKTYQITDATRRVLDYASPATVRVAGVDQTANVASVDYLNGTVTFIDTYTPTTAPTVTGMYVPLVTLGSARGFTLTQTAAEIEDTTYEKAQANNGWRTFYSGLKTVRFEASGIYDAADDFLTQMNSRALAYIEVSPNNSNNTVFRGFFKRAAHGQSGNVGALEESTMTFNLWVPDGSLVESPFRWYFNGSTLNLAVQDVLKAWQAGSRDLDVQYLPDGLKGTQHDAIVTECSLTNAIDGQNEFSFTFRGDGAPVAVA